MTKYLKNLSFKSFRTKIVSSKLRTKIGSSTIAKIFLWKVLRPKLSWTSTKLKSSAKWSVSVSCISNNFEKKTRFFQELRSRFSPSATTLYTRVFHSSVWSHLCYAFPDNLRMLLCNMWYSSACKVALVVIPTLSKTLTSFLMRLIYCLPY